MSYCAKCNEDKNPFPPRVVEIVNEAEPVLFHKVELNANLGTEKETPPESLDYKNVILQYMANNHVYIYSSDGEAVPISTGEINIEEILQQLEEMGLQISELTQTVNSLQEALTIETEARTIADNALQDNINTAKSQLDNLVTTIEGITTDIENNTSNIDDNTSQIDAIKTNLNQTVEYQTSFTSDNSTVTVQHGKVNLNTDEKTTVSEALPVASTTEAGVMNTATFATVENNTQTIQALSNGSVAIGDLPEDPTQEQLTTAWEEATGLTELINRASVFDTTNNKIWTYYSNDTTWYASTNSSEVSVSQATNTSLGTVKGSTVAGQSFVESDGSLSLNGWDATQSSIATLQSTVAQQGTLLNSTAEQLEETQKDANDALGDIATIQADYVKKTGLKTVSGQSLVGSGTATPTPIYNATMTTQTHLHIDDTLPFTPHQIPEGTTFYLRFPMAGSITISYPRTIGLSINSSTINYQLYINLATSGSLTESTSYNMGLSSNSLYKITITADDTAQLDGVKNWVGNSDIQEKSLDFDRINPSTIYPFWDTIRLTSNSGPVAVSSPTNLTSTLGNIYSVDIVNDGDSIQIRNGSSINMVEIFSRVRYSNATNGYLRARHVSSAASLYSRRIVNFSNGVIKAQGESILSPEAITDATTGTTMYVCNVAEEAGSVVIRFNHIIACRVGSSNWWQLKVSDSCGGAASCYEGLVECTMSNNNYVPALYRGQTTGNIASCDHVINILR